jgi:hypothetical protein
MRHATEVRAGCATVVRANCAVVVRASCATLAQARHAVPLQRQRTTSLGWGMASLVGAKNLSPAEVANHVAGI